MVVTSVRLTDMTFNNQGNCLFKIVVHKVGLALVLGYSIAKVLRWLKARQITRSWDFILLHWWTGEGLRSCGCICPKSLPFQLVLLVRMRGRPAVIPLWCRKRQRTLCHCSGVINRWGTSEKSLWKTSVWRTKPIKWEGKWSLAWEHNWAAQY